MKKKILTIAMTLVMLFSTTTNAFAQTNENITQETSNQNSSTQIQATVSEKMPVDYIIEVPEKIDFGQISKTEENKISYSLKVDNLNPDKGAVAVSATKNSALYHNDNDENTIRFVNDFENKTVVEDETINSFVTLNSEDVANAVTGNYTGTVTFSLTYTGLPEYLLWEIIKIVGNDFANRAGITNGLVELTKNFLNSEKLHILIDDFTEEDYALHFNFSEYLTDDLFEKINSSNLSAFTAINDYVRKNSDLLNATLLNLFSVNLVKDSANTKEIISDTGEIILELKLPYNSAEVGSNQELFLLREHDREITEFEKLSSHPDTYKDGTFYVYGGYIYAYTNKNSIYAIGVNDKEDINNDNDNDNNNGDDKDPTNPPTTELTDGEHVADLSLMNATDISIYSMADKLFADEADLNVSGDSVTLTMYVIDPVPNFVDYGTPVKEVYFKNDEDKYFVADGGFILTTGDYPTSKITVTLPKSAVNDSVNGGLLCSAYVNAVMLSRQEFFVVLGIDGATPPPEDPSDSTNPNEPNNPSNPNDTDSPVIPNQNESINGITDGNYTASTQLKKQSNIDEFSMANSLFASISDIQVRGDMADLTMYVIDPIPGYESYGTPVKDIRFTYNSQTYNATVDSTNKVNKDYEGDGRFLDQDGTHPSSKITVTLPLEAITSSRSGTLLCTAYVNAVMQSTQSFYVIFGDLIGGTTAVNPATTQNEVSNLEDNTYSADVSMKRADDINTVSMSSQLFYPKADITVIGDDAELRLYIINPIPNYLDEGTPLSDIVFTYNNNEYIANISQTPYHIGEFAVAEGFIDETGEYTASEIVVNLPTDAIENAANGELLCSAYINVVMESTQSFFVELTNIAIGSSGIEFIDGNTTNIDDEQLPLASGSNGSNIFGTGSDFSNNVPKLFANSTFLFVLTIITASAIIIALTYLYIIRYRRKNFEKV